MDGLGQLARSSFQASRTFRTELSTVDHPTFETSSILGTKESDSVTEVTNITNFSSVTESDLESWVTAEPNTGASAARAEANLRMVCLDRCNDDGLNISKASFEALTNAMGVNPAALYMVCGNYDGFHAFRSPGSLHTWFFGTSSHALLWSFSPAHRRTVGVFIHRRRSLFQDFCRVLSVFSRHIHAPQVLLLTGCVQQQHYFDVETAADLAVIQRIERRTGFGPPAVAGPARALTGSKTAGSARRAEIDELTAWSQSVGEVGGKVSNKIRHQRTAGQMLAALKQDRQNGSAAGLTNGPALAKYESSLHELCDALPTIEQQMATYEEYLTYLRQRTERLSSVLFILLTHVDARASINLAMATKRDSSSMKTVAIMTMAFLPATFFAALFSMPVLEWDKSDVVQNGFWVYWACTLPVTILVFTLWLTITERVWILDRLKMFGRPKGE